MRVVGGEWRSRRLLAPEGRHIRPTSDRLRETLFDILGPAIAGAGFVDAFAGTGAVGIEAYSRGARPVVWVEAAAAAARLLRANLTTLGVADSPAALVLERRLPAAFTVLEGLATLTGAGGARFIFLDPPYADTTAPERCLLALEQRPAIIGADVSVIVETQMGTALRHSIGRWRLRRLHRQGDSQLAFFAAEY